MTLYYKVIEMPFRPSPYTITLNSGSYKFEAWGASGYLNLNCTDKNPPNFTEPGGRGGYTSGILTINTSRTFYVYVGQKGTNNGTFNGEPPVIHGYVPGGGATDFRLVDGKGNWSDFESLKSRIMVAGAGGGADCLPAGDAGGIEGHSMNYEHPKINITASGGTQTSGGAHGLYIDGREGLDGRFGMAGLGYCGKNCDGAASGGSGYYGGGGVAGVGGGGGGSSYISGHDGCLSINEDATNENDLIPTEDSIHYSGLVFNATKMFSGNETMPNYLENGANSIMVGNRGNGYARITYLDPILITFQNNPKIRQNVFVFLFIGSYQYSL